MSAPNSIKSDKLARLIGTPLTPVIVDVRTQEDFEDDSRLIPGALKKSHQTVSEWGTAYAGKSVIVVCHHGAKLSEGSAAWLRQLGADAVAVEGGFVNWEA
jgi:rhodanese-related sulfurtransferase